MKRIDAETPRSGPTYFLNLELLEGRLLLSAGLTFQASDRQAASVVSAEVTLPNDATASREGDSTVSVVGVVSSKAVNIVASSLVSTAASPKAVASPSSDTSEGGDSVVLPSSTTREIQISSQEDVSRSQSQGSDNLTGKVVAQPEDSSSNSANSPTEDTTQTSARGSTGSSGQGGGVAEDTPSPPSDGSTGSSSHGGGSNSGGNGTSASNGSSASGASKGKSSSGGSGSGNPNPVGTTTSTGTVAAKPSTVGPLSSVNPTQGSASVGGASNQSQNLVDNSADDGESSAVSSSDPGLENLDGLVLLTGDGSSITSVGDSGTSALFVSKASDSLVTRPSRAFGIAMDDVGPNESEVPGDPSIDVGGPGLDLLVRLEGAIVRSAIDGLLWYQSSAGTMGAAIVGFDLLVDFMPFDRSSLEIAVDQFIEEFDSSGFKELGSLQAFDLIAGLVTGTAMLSASIFANKLRQKRSDEESFEEESGETSSFAGFPGLPNVLSWEK